MRGLPDPDALDLVGREVIPQLRGLAVSAYRRAARGARMAPRAASAYPPGVSTRDTMTST